MERASCISERRIAEKGLGYTIKKEYSSRDEGNYKRC